MIFWLKARAGWRGKQVVEVTGEDGAVPFMKVIVKLVGDPPVDGPETPMPADNRAAAAHRPRMFPSHKQVGD